ncbi:AAA family ATPase [Vagococcus hydrophili]|uniref:AAA family ATPase n=1 Tax=Vagococcus hydrophili TaxID=2714947 RepID=A0A6G8ARE6_9ENTE|nr:AAA family ATPase [Vagococcus hydrophili]QIL47512.1 AAA family ATPase [Vagococcus hydrophili]
MGLIVLIGPHAVGKMTIGKALEKRIDGKLLFNHQTIDIYANFLGYTKETFRLSDDTRFNLFESFVKTPKTNTTKNIIFTVLADFSSSYDIEFLHKIAAIFLAENQDVFFAALQADMATRLKRNTHEDRLKAKPSKRDLEFSRNELLTSVDKHCLEIDDSKLKELFPEIPTLTINNTKLSAEEVATKVIHHFKLDSR